MIISEEQRDSIKEWLTAGDSLADVQSKLKSEYKQTMTYMDVRLLVLEIGAEIQDEPEPEPKPEPEPSAPMPPEQKATPRPGPWNDATAEAEPESVGEPNVSLSIDRLVVPGAMVSGDVIFTDGTKAHWVIDRMGKFGLEPEVEGYQPLDTDLQEFQMQLRAELQRKGYA